MKGHAAGSLALDLNPELQRPELNDDTTPCPHDLARYLWGCSVPLGDEFVLVLRDKAAVPSFLQFRSEHMDLLSSEHTNPGLPLVLVIRVVKTPGSEAHCAVGYALAHPTHQ
jgi:hypothetical protein